MYLRHLSLPWQIDDAMHRRKQSNLPKNTRSNSIIVVYFSIVYRRRWLNPTMRKADGPVDYGVLIRYRVNIDLSH